jgi:hypothetical protein
MITLFQIFYDEYAPFSSLRNVLTFGVCKDMYAETCLFSEM